MRELDESNMEHNPFLWTAEFNRNHPITVSPQSFVRTL